MHVRKFLVIICAWVIVFCVALIPVFLGVGALRFDANPIPYPLWWVLAIACIVGLAAACFGRRKHRVRR